MAFQGTFAIIRYVIVEQIRFAPVPGGPDPCGVLVVYAPVSALGMGHRPLQRAWGSAHSTSRVARSFTSRPERLPALRPSGSVRDSLQPPAPSCTLRPVHTARRCAALVRLVRFQRRQRPGFILMLAFVNTLLAPSGALVTWTLLDLFRTGRATAVGVDIGARRRAGSDPARRSSTSTPSRRLRTVLSPSAPNYYALLWRVRTRLDDALDVGAAHGLGGITGALLARPCWHACIRAAQADGLLFGNPSPRLFGVFDAAWQAGIAQCLTLDVRAMEAIPARACHTGGRGNRARRPASTARRPSVARTAQS